jgi:hypothetical protein
MLVSQSAPTRSTTAHGVTTDHAVKRAPGALATLDGLLCRPASELARMYREARTPTLGEVKGDLRGRMLAWPVLEERPAVAHAIRTFAGSSSFPWRGKSFAPRDEARGDGINRVAMDRFRLFRFETFIGRSRGPGADFDALQLDYDLPGNPPVIRSIKDEIRTIEPGVWLGQAWFVTPKTTFLWLYFGLAAA